MKKPPRFDRHTAAGRTFTQIILEIFRLDGSLRISGDQLARDQGLTVSRWRILGSVLDTPKPVPNIARERGLKRQSVQRTVTSMVRAGLARLIDNPNHRRAKLVEITPEGAAKVARVHQRQMDWANAIGAAASPADLETALAVLHKLRKKLDETPAREFTVPGARTKPRGASARRRK